MLKKEFEKMTIFVKAKELAMPNMGLRWGGMWAEQMQQQFTCTTLSNPDHQANGLQSQSKTRSSHEISSTSTMTSYKFNRQSKIHGDIARCYMWGVTTWMPIMTPVHSGYQYRLDLTSYSIPFVSDTGLFRDSINDILCPVQPRSTNPYSLVPMIFIPVT